MSAPRTHNSKSVKNLTKVCECILAHRMQMMHNAGRQNIILRSIQQGPRPVIEPSTCHYDEVLYQVTDGSQISIKKISVGELSVGEMSVGKISVGEMSCRQSAWVVADISVGKLSVGEMSVGKMSGQRNVCR